MPDLTFDALLKQRDDDAAVVVSDTSAIASAVAEVTAANLKLGDANTKLGEDRAVLAEDEVEIGAAVAAKGPYFVGPKSDGTVDAYLSDGNGSYHVTVLKPSTGPA